MPFHVRSRWSVSLSPRRACAACVMLACAEAGSAAGVRAQDTSPAAYMQAAFRALSVAPDGVIWAAGTKGTVLRSTDAGTRWSIDTLPGGRWYDLRGLAAIDARTAFVMVPSTDTARIYKTTDMGKTWTLRYNDVSRGAFLDGMGCWTARRCLAAGDPIRGRFVVITTVDGGRRWTRIDPSTAPSALPGEVAFAASNTTVITRAGGRAWIVTGGGPVARVWRTSDYGMSWRVAPTPVVAGKPSAGLVSMAMCDNHFGVAVGGDFAETETRGRHVAITFDGGASWTSGDAARATPYFSGVTCVPVRGRTLLMAVGPNGAYTSADSGQTWAPFRLDAPYNSVVAVPGWVIAVGARSAVKRVAITDLPSP